MSGWQRPYGCICPSSAGDGSDRYNPQDCPVHGSGSAPWAEPAAVVETLELLSASLRNISNTQAAQLILAADAVRSAAGVTR